MGRQVRIYDATLRDGTQAEGVSFSLLDKLEITQELDKLGLDYIEGGYPGSNPKDIEFFEKIKKISLKKAKVSAFGMTRKKNTRVEEDATIRALMKAETEVVTLVGKSWILHVEKALRTNKEENLRMIGDSVNFFKKKGKEVIFDAEHFFDGYKDDLQYALKTLKVAQAAGADCLVLCDTNGGSMPFEIEKIIKEVQKGTNSPLGMHAHNDAGLGVANSVIAARLGIGHIQGTINGYGERCGNADLCSVIPNLILKLGINCIPKENLKLLTHTSHFISELANLSPDGHQSYVGKSAFAHKGGMHASAISRDKRTYEHIDPELLGNRRRVLVSELAGRSNVLYKLKEKELGLEEDTVLSKKIITRIKELENQGYEFEGAEGSFELLVKKAKGKYKKLFELEGFRVTVEKRDDGRLISEATVKLKLKGKIVHTVAEGNGPVNALDKALRKALKQEYPELSQMHLADYKVRILDARAGTRAKTRVLIESSDKEDRWVTVGVSPNIIEASWEALIDSIEYKLLK
ncbi:MAG TPA: citramalate synthase [Candidatus Aerophobetes bacterium]|uniref:Citramalate synthase n=1 Tax=Aerophobetes bacterium TaxID=2030807 RepID=A0A7C1MAX4_UNCAE|nr:citramalate synthase [Candidatus Aerophobetes bacterium]